MKKLLLTLCLAVAFSAPAQVTILSTQIKANSATPDTVFFDIADWDYFGVWVEADSDAFADVFFDYRGRPSTDDADDGYQTYSDSIQITSGTTGGGKLVVLRSPVTERVPFGANFLRVRRANRGSGNGSATKGFYIVIDGMAFREKRMP